MEPRLSWDLVDVLRQLFEFPFMVNAFLAATAVAVSSALVGWFTVLRRATFTAHTLAIVGFPGASLAALVGASVGLGYVLFAAAAAAVVALGSRRARTAERESALVGTVQAVALASGFLFASLSHRNISSAQALLFGSVLGITRPQVVGLLAVAVAVLMVLAAVGRPLLFASVDPQVATARRVPAAGLHVVFLGLLALAAATASQITGALLAFALLVIPAATAQLLVARVWWSLALAIALALLAAWSGLVAAYFGDWPIGFSVPTVAFAVYLLARGVARLRGLRRAALVQRPARAAAP